MHEPKLEVDIPDIVLHTFLMLREYFGESGRSVISDSNDEKNMNPETLYSVVGNFFSSKHFYSQFFPISASNDSVPSYFRCYLLGIIV